MKTVNVDNNILSYTLLQSEQGDTEAQYVLGTMYLSGTYIKKNVELGVHWIRKAAIKDHPNALYYLGYMYGYGENFLPIDWPKAIKFMIKSAEQGFPLAQSHLSSIYLEGEVIEADFEKSAYWAQKAAEEGDSLAQFNLGLLYLYGYGISQNDDKAAHWFKMAAAQGIAGAQFYIGKMYANGVGVKQDLKVAFNWIQKSAKQGLGDAQSYLALMYANGKGVAIDKKLAYCWSSMVAEHDKNAQQLVTLLIAELSEQEITEAESLIPSLMPLNSESSKAGMNKKHNPV